MTQQGHEVRLIAPHYVKPFIKRQKNDAADAEAIVEAALRPTMRFVEPKTADQQARAIAFRTREQLVKQRTETINALRSHLYEFGHVAPTGIGFVPRLAKVVEDPDTDMPELARDICRMLLEQIAHLTERLKDLKARIETMSDEAEMPRRLRTMPGVGPITALAVETFAPPMDQFRRGRDFAAWLGLVPRQHSTGGKQRLGKTSKMGQRDIRRLLITGAMAVTLQCPARDAAVVILIADQHPALGVLAGDVRLASLPLGVEAVELLLQPFLGGLARVDRAALFSHDRLGHVRALRDFKPKNTQPFQRVPVIARAMADSDL